MMTMNISEDRRYSYDMFLKIETNGNIKELDPAIISKINTLANRVGAPNYQKTPVFKRRNYKKKCENVLNEDWESIRNFKHTVLNKNKNGIESKMDQIQSYLNKLTDGNYGEIYNCIIIIIKDIIDENYLYLEKIGESIFNIGSLNKFWSSLYARLYKDLIDVYPIMQQICLTNFNSFESLFNNINYINPDDNYNLFCEYNKQNEKRRALCNFFIHCANLKIIDKKDIQQIIINFIKKINDYMKLENKNEIIDEITQNLSIMIISGKDFIKLFDNYIEIKNDIELLSNIHRSEYPSINQKIIFKFMDLNDELEDE